MGGKLIWLVLGAALVLPGTAGGLDSVALDGAAARPKVLHVETGGDTACALLASGRVACWGDNTAGQLGVGRSTGPSKCTDGPCSRIPRRVHGLAGVKQI